MIVKTAYLNSHIKFTATKYYEFVVLMYVQENIFYKMLVIVLQCTVLHFQLKYETSSFDKSAI